MKNCALLLPLAVAATVSFAGQAGAAIMSTAATTSATVQPAGPRTGTSGINYLNVEGSDNGSFASYGVVDFDASALGFGPVSTISGATLTLTESNAGFTTPGNVNLYLTQDTSTTIANDGTSPLTFDATNPPGGLASGALSPLMLVGASVPFAGTNSGDTDVYALSLDAAAATYMLSQINNGGTLRFVIAADQTGVAATWAGATNSTYDAPMLSVDAGAVPEPASLGLVVLGGLALLRRR